MDKNRVYIKDLKVGDVLLKHKFAIKDISLKKGKTGSNYYTVVLSDKTGSVGAKIWSNSFAECDLSKAKSGSVVEVNGKVDSFNNKAQIIIEKMSVCSDYNADDFIPTGDRDLNKIYNELISEVKSLDDEEVKQMILSVFSNDEFTKKYKEVPAAEVVHQDYVGGLLEHTYEMLKIAKACKDLYPNLRYSELVFGIIFHDVGKIYELTTTGVTLERTLPGYLLGHMIQGLLFINTKFPKDFTNDKKVRLLHMIVSHNGAIELGAPVTPMTLEAILLSAIDDLSFKAGTYYSHIRKNEPDEKGLLGYSKYLGATLLKQD